MSPSLMVSDPYIRAARVVRVVDGDTFVADVDLGFHVTVRMACRIAGIQAPELHEPGGPEAKTALASLLARGSVTVMSVRSDKYAGRFDADVVVADPPGTHDRRVWSVAPWLVTHGYAVEWSGIGVRPTVPWPPTGGTGDA